VGGEHVIEFELDPAGPPVAPASYAALPTVNADGVRTAESRVTLTAAEPHRALPALLDVVRASGAKLTALTTRTATLEDVFVTLTGRHLRDAE
jgi:ABC-2 type transport system ATP-binding protein